jgi:hypothetical protein
VSESGTSNQSALKSCFISAPAGTQLHALRASLKSRGLRVLVPQDLASGNDWATEIQKQLSQADIVIGVITSDRESPWVLFELGQAFALGRRIILISTEKVDSIPFASRNLVILRIDLDNQKAIDFALDQLLAAPSRPKDSTAPHLKPTLKALGSDVDNLMLALDQALTGHSGLAFERVVADALRSSGTDVIVASFESDIGADFAVWSDVLEPFVGNPLLIEVKARIRGKGEASLVMRQLSSYLGQSGARWALLLYGDGPDNDEVAWPEVPSNVLLLSLRSLLESLRTRSFPEVVRDLRNQRVHGAID